MKVVVIGHGMVGHKFIESVQDAPGVDVTVLCEEPRAAYDRVHLSEFFAGKTADDLSLVAPGFFDRSHLDLRLNAKAQAIDRAARTVALANTSLS
jgi:nitrite reductase (NADH) large subunit